MALSRLENLYRHVILDHSSNPRNFGSLEDANGMLELNNPTCGDVIQLYLRLEGDRIEAAKFSGHGCSISTASASMMTEQVIGKTVPEAREMIEEFLLLVQGKLAKEENHLGDAEILSGVAKFPARIKCATLSWKALERILLEQKEETNE
ncbi:Fe-S cluster assembly sulfur transfer protein SufU [Jeotgalibaca caeni]|uniref:Fe-S cluster assembly sulfur transfer protein SufU n=1 Tax=Jeotgalibaca caeni TaxID=3028623 RepID=UPI00237DD289|nr:SUF system NifU family Fe-S cluster assembly protein [Jeotgalibaca caeni]MDE1549501.1 SUF system NifU family Fe-S cluster assembly protein [Jeotgalibaca caeni]